jgi:hypothetical protein
VFGWWSALPTSLRSSFGPRCAGSCPAHPSRSTLALRRCAPRGKVVLPPVVLHAHFRSVSDVASAPDVVFGDGKSRSRAPPAGRLREQRGCSSCWGWRVVVFWVACAGRVALLAWHRRRPGTCREGKRRQLPWMLNFTFAACPPDRTTGRASPARRGERPDLSYRSVRCARHQSRRCSSMLNSTSGDHLRLRCALDRAGPGIFCSSRPPVEPLN